MDPSTGLLGKSNDVDAPAQWLSRNVRDKFIA